MNINEILKYLPHRYPFLLVDRIIDLQLGKSIVGIKNVTMNEPFFNGHFPENPIMPGVMIIEALAQTAGILAFKSTENDCDNTKHILYLAGIDEARFKRIVVPGDQLRLEGEIVKVKQDIWKLKAMATVEGEMACSAMMLAAKKDISRD